MLYDDIIEIVKTWSALGQFVFFFIVALFGLMPLMLVLGIIGEFFTETLPVIIRGHPTHRKDETGSDKGNG